MGDHCVLSPRKTFSFCIWSRLFTFHVFDTYIGRNGVGIPKQCFLIAGVDSQWTSEHTSLIDKCLAQWPIERTGSIHKMFGTIAN